jgi:hypothetical protein
MDEVVPDTFATRLHAVMAHFSLDSAALAQGLSVDPSVVDAWLCGEQSLHAGSDTLRRMVEYFSNCALGLKDMNWFYKQFQQSGAPLDVITAADMRPLLAQWLGADTSAGEMPPLDNTMPPAPPPSPAAHLSTRFFERASQEAFSVQAGLSNIVLSLDKLLGNLPEGSDLNIHLFSNAMRSITEPTVVGRISHYVQSLALRARLLMSVSDSTSALPAFIKLYLPLLTAGNMQIYTVDSLSHPLTNQISLQAGRHALLITEAGDAAAPPVSMLVSERSTLVDLQKNAERSLRYARPLFISLSGRDGGKLREALHAEYCATGDLDIVSDCPLPMFMTPDAFTALLGGNGLSGEALEEQSAAFIKLQTAMSEALGAGRHTLRIMLRLSRLKQVLDEGQCQAPGYLFMQDDSITMNAAACAASLTGLVDYLNRFPDSLHLHLTNNIEPFCGDCCWHMKRDRHVCIASFARGMSNVLYTDEPALVREDSARYHALWLSNSKVIHSRERTIFTLTEAIRLLHERYLN